MAFPLAKLPVESRVAMHYTEETQCEITGPNTDPADPKGWRVAITIKCPFCGTSADIEEALLGKKLRCAEKNCRKAFRVTPDGQSLPVVERDKSRRSSAGLGSGADWASNPPPPVKTGPDEGDWLSAPPPVSGGEIGRAHI